MSNLTNQLFRNTFTSKTSIVSTSSIEERKIYIASIYSLAKRLVIKSTETAEIQDDYYSSLIPDLEPGSIPKEDWIYYKHLAGEPLYGLDVPMTMTSMDTLEEITLSVTELEDHPVTREALMTDDKVYQTLVNSYPTQEVLIRGMLNPIDKQTAINAEDGTILYYPEHLVEKQELTLIEDLEDWIKNFKARWHIAAFTVTDPLYMAAHLGILYTHLVPAIITLREERLHTPQAHSFHIGQYLSSHGLLDRYIDYLSIEQQLSLYRNIRWVEKHSGHTKVFKYLVHTLLEKAGINLDGCTVELAKLTGGLTPVFKSVKYSPDDVSPGSSYNLDQYRDLENPIAEANPKKTDDIFAEEVKLAKYSTVKTKLLTSTSVGSRELYSYGILDVLVNHLGYFSHYGRYDTRIDFTGPLGAQVTLSAKDTYVYMVLLAGKIQDIPMVNIPPYVYIPIVQAITKLQLNTGFSPVEPRFGNYPIEGGDFPTMHGMIPPIYNYHTPETFADVCKRIHEARNDIYTFVNSRNDPKARAALEAILMEVYIDPVIQIEAGGSNTQTWLMDRNLDIATASETDLIGYFEDVFNAATAYQFVNSVTAQGIRDATLTILTQLSSYGVQINQHDQNTNAIISDMRFDEVIDVRSRTI